MPPIPEGGVYTGPGLVLETLLGTPKLQLVVATSPVNSVTIASLSHRPNLNGRKHICLVRSMAGEIASDAEIGDILLETLQRTLAAIMAQVNLLLWERPCVEITDYRPVCAFKFTKLIPDCTLSGTSACGHQSLKASSARSHWMRWRTLFSRTRKRTLSSSAGSRSKVMLAG